MKFIKTNFSGLYILEPLVFDDDRGYFFEAYNSKKFKENIHDINFIQDNESQSVRGVLRGLHFQKPPFDQAKLVRCIKGKILDVALDIRKYSKTYGKHFSIELSSENKRQLFIPRGFAHGFSVLSDNAIFSYKVDNLYAPDFESGIKFNDKNLNINWKLNESEFILSEKDKNLIYFEDLESPF